jgi:putative NIF3 family GTP cyclohydrolase 1 type 2
MKKISLDKIVTHCQSLLRVSEFEDWSQAINGLQVANSGKVTRIAAAVDISPQHTLRMAREVKADLMLVHHGFFWAVFSPGPAAAMK